MQRYSLLRPPATVALLSGLAGIMLTVASCSDLIGLGLTQVGVTDGNNATARRVLFDSNRAELAESIYPFGDYDVYDLGAHRSGTALRLEVDASLLLAGLALVNGDTSVLLDGLDGNAPNLTAIEHVLASDVERLLLYVGPGHVRLPPLEILPVPVGGDYRVTVTMLGTAAVPPPRPQVVVLDFAGGQDERFFGHPIDIAPFRPGAYHPKLGAFSDLVRNTIMETVQATYRDYNVRVLTSQDRLPDGPSSRVYITSPGYFQVGQTSYAGGQVRYIDFGNRDMQDVAIVSPSAFAEDDTRGGHPAQFGRVLGELAAHEIGHLLGLTHQVGGLMSYQRSIDLVDAPLAGFFGFTDPGSAGLFPDTPELIQLTSTYLTRVVGKNPAGAQKPRPSANRRGSRRASRK